VRPLALSASWPHQRPEARGASCDLSQVGSPGPPTQGGLRQRACLGRVACLSWHVTMGQATVPSNTARATSLVPLTSHQRRFGPWTLKTVPLRHIYKECQHLGARKRRTKWLSKRNGLLTTMVEFRERDPLSRCTRRVSVRRTAVCSKWKSSDATRTVVRVDTPMLTKAVLSPQAVRPKSSAASSAYRCRGRVCDNNARQCTLSHTAHRRPFVQASSFNELRDSRRHGATG
jgi:hypothetical protein